jgi:uncharacterized protein YjlB
MVEVKTYHIKPTKLIPNSPYPLLHYPGLLLDTVTKPDFNATHIQDIFGGNGWHTQWVFRYAATQTSHYHSTAHECMAVVSGTGATIRFGSADTSDNMDNNTYGTEGVDYEEGGVEVKAGLGDVFVIPAGVAHKTFDVDPESPGLKQMASESGHLPVEREEARRALEKVDLSGGHFMMCGAYPLGSDWDFKEGGEHQGRFEEVWGVKKPEKDPVLGVDEKGLVVLWRGALM